MTSSRIDIFISHVHDDETLASTLKDFLEGLFLNANVFVSGRDLTGGEVWIEELRARLDRSTAIIALVTQLGKNSDWVHFEAGAGFARKCTIPLVAGDVSLNALEPPLKLLQARTLDETGLQLLAQDVARLAELRQPDKYPGLEETIRVAEEFLNLRAESTTTEPSELAVANVASIAQPDQTLVARLRSLEDRAKKAIANAVGLRSATFDVPNRDEIEAMTLHDACELAEAVGVSVPFGILRVSLHSTNMPDEDAPPWRKMNKERVFKDIEDGLIAFERSVRLSGA